MRRALTALSFPLLLVLATSRVRAEEFVWARQLQGATNDEVPTEVTVDAAATSTSRVTSRTQRTSIPVPARSS